MKAKRIIAFIVAGVVLFFVFKTCHSRAEEDPWTFGSQDFFTPDPSGDVYEVIDTQAPVAETAEPEQEQITGKDGKEEGKGMLGAPFPVSIRYDPFFVRFVDGVEKWRRLNGSDINLTPPVSTSYLHSISPSSQASNTADTQNWWSDYGYTWTVNNVNQSTSWHRPGSGCLTYVLYQDLTTSQSSKQIKKGDYVEFAFVPNVVFNSTVNEDLYDPVVRVNIMLTFTGGNGHNTTITVEPFEMKLSDRVFSYRYQIEQSGWVYLSQYRIEVTINPLDIDPPEPSDPAVIYYYTQTEASVFNLTTWHDKTFMESVGTWFNNLSNHFTDLFIPNSDMVATWISDHSSDQLDVDNPLNLIKDLFVNLCQKFSGSHSSRPLEISVPALTFNVDGQSVTPFAGYTWRPGSEGIVDTQNGYNLWYYVKLVNSVLICSGLIALMYRWFVKWYDAHYANGEGGDKT